MPGEGGRRGRRDNGLDAAAFVPLVDVDPRVGEHLLDVLGSAGVPAFLEPSSDVEPYTRAVSLPSPPTDRLWVDRDQRKEAREIVEAETPEGTRPKPAPREDEPSRGLTDQAEERAWQQIIAGWERPPTRRPRAADPDPGGTDPADLDPGGTDPGGSDPGGRRQRTGRAGDRADDRDPADPARTDADRSDRDRTDRDRTDRGPGDPAGDGTEPGTGDDGEDGPAEPRRSRSIDRIGPDGHRHSDGPRSAPADGDAPPRGTHSDRTGTHTWDDADLWGSTPADRTRRRLRRNPAGTDAVPSGRDLDRAAEARAKAEAEAADEVWVVDPPTLDDGTEEHFEPPPPPPVPRPSRHAVLAGILVVLGILLMARPRLVGLDDRGGLTLGVLAILGGGVLLVLRLRDTRSDDGPDDGAIV